MRYLTREQILLIHSIVIDETGGMHGLRDSAAIFAVVDLPRQSAFGKELYPTIYTKAAIYARNIISSHPFIDGNKRTAMTAASVFLENNGHEVAAHKGEIAKFAHKIISNHLDLPAISLWFKKHSEKRKGKKR